MRLPTWLDPPPAQDERHAGGRVAWLPQWLDPPPVPEEHSPAEPSKHSAATERAKGSVAADRPERTPMQEETTGAGLNVGPAVGTFAVVVGLAIFPIAALLLCIGILALVHAIF